VFLQQQLDEKERTIQLLQLQMTKYTNSDATTNAAGKDSCNAATQTERVCISFLHSHVQGSSKGVWQWLNHYFSMWAIWRVTSDELLTKQEMRKNYYIQKICTYLSYFSI
jgi:hypothetical protein